MAACAVGVTVEHIVHNGNGRRCGAVDERRAAATGMTRLAVHRRASPTAGNGIKHCGLGGSVAGEASGMQENPLLSSAYIVAACAVGITVEHVV